MVQLSCKKHPRYKATDFPRASCEPCIKLYELKQMALANRLEVK